MCDQKDCANNLVLVFIVYRLYCPFSSVRFVDGDDDDDLGIKVVDIAFVTRFTTRVHTFAL